MIIKIKLHIPKLEVLSLNQLYKIMQILKKPIFFLLFFWFLISTKCMENNTNLSDLCLIQVCSYREPVNRYVQFPFLISNESLPRSCGYPGFNLLCNEDDELLINLPNSGVFSVQEIDYVHQELWVNDLDNCLPKRLLSINNASNFVGNSPFSPVLEQDYWFFNCSNDFFNSSDDDQVKPIECLSGQSYGVFASPLEKIVKGNSSLCVKIGPIKVPITKRSNKDMYSSSDLKDDIKLTWAQPRECRECYQRDGKCRFKSNSSLEVGCFNLPRRGFSRGAMIVIALAFATPLILVTICITYFFMKAFCLRRRATNARLTSLVVPSTTITPQPQHVIHGLDQSIIESYPKVVLGESRRLPKPDEKSCPICLGDYLAKEILRTIPECCHCFHADCIDEWLLLNASCPVCRYSPSKTPEINV